MIRHNWKYKLLAMAVSLSLCIYVNSIRNPQSQRTFTVPVKTVDLARGYVADPETPKVTVKIEGPKTAVDAISKEDVEAWVRMGGVKQQKRLDLSLAVEVHLPPAAKNDLYYTPTPKRIKVHVEAIEQKRLPVEVAFTADPPLGYSYSNPLLTPSIVTVSGRFSQLAKVSKAILTLSGDAPDSATDDFYDVAAVDGSGNPVPEVNVQPMRVKAKLEVVEVPATKAVVVSPVFSGQPKFPLRVSKYTVTPSSVTLEGKPSVLGRVSVVSTERIALEGADATVGRDVDLRVPSGVKVSGSHSVRVTVYIGSN